MMDSYTAFLKNRKLASGPLGEVVTKVKKSFDRDNQSAILIFNDENGRAIDFNLRGSMKEVLERLPRDFGGEADRNQGPGRPRLGVIAREVTLLPRHWEWLALQPEGASATLRRLVENEKKRNREQDQIRQAQEAAYRFMNTMAGDLVGFEEALRSLYAGNSEAFKRLTDGWPKDVREHSRKLAKPAFNRSVE